MAGRPQPDHETKRRQDQPHTPPLSAEEKVRLLKLHLVEGQPISAICDLHQIHPTLFYSWQKTFFENGAAAFDRTPRPRRVDLGTQKIEHLEARLKRKDEVIACRHRRTRTHKKRTWGALKETWTPPDERDAVVDSSNV